MDSFKSCDFESETSCIFEPKYSRSGLKWQIYQASQFNNGTLIDHTTHTPDGHFYGMDLAKVANGLLDRRFLVETDKLSIYQINCIRFSYFMDVQPNISLFYELTYEGGSSVPQGGSSQPWTVAGTTLGMWFSHQAKLQRPSDASQFRVRFGINTGGQAGSGLVFVDDILLNQGNCYSVGECDFEVLVS